MFFSSIPNRAAGGRRLVLLLGLFILAGAGTVFAHIVPPEPLHPGAASYRRLGFLLELNPVPWHQVQEDLGVIADCLEEVDPAAVKEYRRQTTALLAPFLGPPAEGEPPAPEERSAATRRLFEEATRAMSAALRGHLAAARGSLEDHRLAAGRLDEARALWKAFEPTLRAADPVGFRDMGLAWLEMSSALGDPGILGAGAVSPNPASFSAGAAAVEAYFQDHLGEGFQPSGGRLAPLPAHVATAAADLPAALPPGAQINKQLPRPRQILNMASRGVDESETPLIALGDMAFDSPMIFGEPARSLGISCNTCHNKGVTNPAFRIPGLSSVSGGMDVSNSFFAGHANNGHFDPLDIPDLRGLRFTAPYGRNGRFESLREFTRNVIVNEFNGPEPDPLLLDGLVAYQLEFDFLPNPLLGRDGRLSEEASVAARRGEEIFHRPFEQMGGRSCATCHVPADHFLDRRRHDIGTRPGSETGSRDRALDTPTLLSSRYTAPYFHDGSQPTLLAVNEWFDETYGLGLGERELADLTAYLEAVGDGVGAYEDTVHTLDSELEEFSFFLSTYEFLKRRGRQDLMDTTFETIAFEIRAHKWDLKDPAHLPVLDRMAQLMDEALAARRRGDFEAVEARVAEYRSLYRENVEVLR